MNISPSTGIIESVRKQSLPWSTILAELVDNSFDASANQVVIEFSSEQLVVQDDGNGCQDLGLFLQMGKRRQVATTRLGRYGIGAKDAIISAGDSVEVISVHKGVKRKIMCNWKSLEKLGTWDIEDPSEFPSTDASGTCITITKLRSDRLKRPEDVTNKLSLQYTPAIREGKQIIFKPSSKAKRETIPEFRIPPLEHVIQTELTVGHKKARLMVGLTPEGHVCKMSGLVIAYGFRVIESESRIGLGDEPTPGLFGWLDLLDGWELTKNKDRIIDLTDLASEINDACKAVIEMARKRCQSIAFLNISKQINDVLKEILTNGRKEKRKKPPESKVGTIEPKGTSRRRRNATNTQPKIQIEGGDIASKGLKVGFERMGSDGPAWKCQGSIVYLNTDIPAIEINDERIVTYHAVHAVSAYMVLRDRCGTLFPFSNDDDEQDFQKIASASGYLLSRIASLRDKDIKQAS